MQIAYCPDAPRPAWPRPVVALGNNVFAVQPRGAPAAERFSVVPAATGRAAYAEMLLWTFPRVSR